MESYHDYDAVKGELMRMELDLQAERNVPLVTSMFELICDSHAASLYVQSFLDRKRSSKDFNKDLDDGSKTVASSRSPANAQAKSSGNLLIPKLSF